jgi:hypothetical protein
MMVNMMISVRNSELLIVRKTELLIVRKTELLEDECRARVELR